MLSRAASVLVEPLQRQLNAVRKLGFWVRIAPRARMLVSCDFVCLQVQVSSSGVDQSSRGVLPRMVCPVSVIVKLHKGKPLDRRATCKEDMLRRMDNILPINIIDWLFISSLEWFCYYLSWLSCHPLR